MLKPKSKAVTDAVERTLRALAAYQRGQVCPWSAVEKAAGFERGTTHWTAFRVRLDRAVMRTRGVTLWAVPGVGLQLLDVADTLRVVPKKRNARARRQYTKTIRSLAAIPARELTDRQQIERATTVDSVKEARRKTLEAGRTLAALASGRLVQHPLPERTPVKRRGAFGPADAIKAEGHTVEAAPGGQ